MLDPVTQQYYLRARFYNPVIGRFTQEDTYYGDGLNLYQYCQANPVGYVDPSGHNCETTQSRYNSNEEQHPKADAAEAYQSATEKGNSKTSYGKSSGNISELLENRPELTGTNREKLLSMVQDTKLAAYINEVYRPGASVGDGGTADKLIMEFYEGSSRHLPKAKERLVGINRIIDSGKLGLNDLDIAEALRDDLEYAIDLFK